MKTKTVVEQSQLRGSSQDAFLQRVATVYLDGEEYRVLAPPKAVGEAIDWIDHFSVRQPDRESFHSEILVEGAFRILAIKLVKEELEKMKTAAGKSAREESRKIKLRELLDGLSHLRLCGPSDDPDEQTSVLESYRYLLINVKALSKGLVPSDISEQLDAVPSNLESIYDVYESKAHLDAVCVDIEAELDNPTSTGVAPSRTSLVAPQLVEELSKVKPSQFDATKLTGYCKENKLQFLPRKYCCLPSSHEDSPQSRASSFRLQDLRGADCECWKELKGKLGALGGWAAETRRPLRPSAD